MKTVEISEYSFVANYRMCPHCCWQLDSKITPNKGFEFKGECPNPNCKVQPTYKFIIRPITEENG